MYYVETKPHIFISASVGSFSVGQCGILSMIDTPILSSI